MQVRPSQPPKFLALGLRGPCCDHHISTLRSAEASAAWTVARAGAQPGGTHFSQTPFISAKSAMSVSQILAERSRALSVPAFASSASICSRISPGLESGALAFGLLGDDAGKIDGIAPGHSAAQSRSGFVAFDCHAPIYCLSRICRTDCIQVPLWGERPRFCISLHTVRFPARESKG